MTIPKAVREALGIGAGDEVFFEATEDGYTIRMEAPTTMEGEDLFETYRGRSSGARVIGSATIDRVLFWNGGPSASRTVILNRAHTL